MMVRGVFRCCAHQVLTVFLGLHLSPKAYDIVVEELQSLIACAYPDQVAEKLSPVLPNWNDGDAWKKFEDGCSK